MLKPPWRAREIERSVPDTDCMQADTTGMFTLKRGGWFGSTADRGVCKSTTSELRFFRVSLGINKYSLKVRDVSASIVAIKKLHRLALCHD